MSAAKLFLTFGAVNALLSVALGAFAAHGLKHTLSSDSLAVFQTGVHYQFFHALGLLAVGILAHLSGDNSLIRLAGWLMLAGIFLFSGSLYVLGLTGTRLIGIVTPIGGFAFIAAWLTLTIALWRSSW